MPNRDIPAFPGQEKDRSGNHYQSHTGITLHQWYMGMALQGELARPREEEWDTDNAHIVALRCSKFADAMVKRD